MTKDCKACKVYGMEPDPRCVRGSGCSIRNEELKNLVAECRHTATSFPEPYAPTIIAALINYRAAELLADRLSELEMTMRGR